MSNAKVVMGQAANTLVKPLNVEDVFSTYLYEGTGAAQTITNGIDLDGEGGLVWIKSRTEGTYGGHALYDTERGATNPNNVLSTSGDSGVSSTAAQYTSSPADKDLTSFNSNGFSLGPDNYFTKNTSGNDYASWTFRKAPRFFTCLTYTGTGSAQNIAHDLGDTPGTIIIKGTDYVENWIVYHRSLGATKYIQLNTTGAASTSSIAWNDTEPTSTEFTVNSFNAVNESGYNYVAYLFAHNDGDGGFNGGDIIKCGSFTAGSSGVTQQIDLGWEPQWVLVKNVDDVYYAEWRIYDVMRGMSETASENLKANASDAAEVDNPLVTAYSQGFKGDFSAGGLATNDNYIYIAIRRGTKVPESGTEVFAMDTLGGTSPNPPDFYSGWPVDMSMFRRRSQTANWATSDRLRGPTAELRTNSTEAEQSTADVGYDQMTGYFDDSNVVSDIVSWMWKRAPGFFDVVAYTGNGTAGHTVSHNLGVAPEMMWVKRRESTGVWGTYHSGVDATSPEDFYLKVESTGARVNDARFWNDTAPDDTVFTLGTHSQVNFSGGDYIAYLFASLPGISKVGSYTGNGTSQTIDCGFTSGARFILVKRTDSTGDWWVFDTERGLGKNLRLNTTDTESSNTGMYADSSGFLVLENNPMYLNTSGASYIFYAIA